MMLERALELGRLLGQSDEYRALHRANERLKADQEAGGLFEQLKRLDEQIQRALADGREPPEPDRQAYESLMRRIEGLATYQGYVAAQANFDKLMAKVNQQILDGMRKAMASPIITLG